MTSTAATQRRADSRVLIVTGASSGIGAALAAHGAAQGWNVVCVARRAERIESLVAGICASGGSAVALACDVTAADAPQRIVDAAMRAYGRIDVLVNNAGYATLGALLDHTDALIENQWQLHVAGPLRIARLALPHIRDVGGGIVFLGSGVARVPIPRYGAYCAAKAAVRAAAIQLRRELKADGIFVTYVDPGVVDTEFANVAGLAMQPVSWHGKPDAVARRILRGIDRRAARVNAIPWQTAATVFGEWFPAIADAAMARVVAGPTQPAQPTPQATPQPAPQPGPPPPIPPDAPVADNPTGAPRTAFESALEPVARRMERVKLNAAFMRDLLAAETTIELNDAAMRWAGMPNKNERAAMHEVLQALAAAGYLEPQGVETWKVSRAPE